MEDFPFAFEILIVDDGSHDKTAEQARTTSARVVQHRQNRGYGEALKTGIRHAKYERIAIIDADGSYPAVGDPASGRAPGRRRDGGGGADRRERRDSPDPSPGQASVDVAGQLPDWRQDPRPELGAAPVPPRARHRVLRPAAVEVLVHHHHHPGRARTVATWWSTSRSTTTPGLASRRSGRSRTRSTSSCW